MFPFTEVLYWERKRSVVSEHVPPPFCYFKNFWVELFHLYPYLLKLCNQPQISSIHSFYIRIYSKQNIHRKLVVNIHILEPYEKLLLSTIISTASFLLFTYFQSVIYKSTSFVKMHRKNYSKWIVWNCQLFRWNSWEGTCFRWIIPLINVFGNNF